MTVHLGTDLALDKYVSPCCFPDVLSSELAPFCLETMARHLGCDTSPASLMRDVVAFAIWVINKCPDSLEVP